MDVCFVYGKPITEDDKFIWFKVDKDKIHEKCKDNHQKACEWVNSLTEEEFNRYVLGEW